MQAVEVCKLLGGVGDVLSKKLLIFDALAGEYYVNMPCSTDKQMMCFMRVLRVVGKLAVNMPLRTNWSIHEGLCLGQTRSLPGLPEHNCACALACQSWVTIHVLRKAGSANQGNSPSGPPCQHSGMSPNAAACLIPVLRLLLLRGITMSVSLPQACVFQMPFPIPSQQT